MSEPQMPSTSSESGGKASLFANTPFGLIHQIITVLTFLGCWAYAIALWGWFIGGGLGWMPAVVIAGIVALLFPIAAFLTFIALLIGAVVTFVVHF